MITRLSIKNFKSIVDQTLELGRINVFIGENGSGKTNLLEAVAMAGACLGGIFVGMVRPLSTLVETHELYDRGVRIAKPSMMRSSFTDSAATNAIEIKIERDTVDSASATEEPWTLHLTLYPEDPDSIDTPWRAERAPLDDRIAALREQLKRRMASPSTGGTPEDVLSDYFNRADDDVKNEVDRFSFLRTFYIYNPTSQALRGIEVSSRLAPVGLHGENLDVLLAGFTDEQLRELAEHAAIIPWFDELFLDPQDRLKLDGHKLGRSVSRLYFRDRLMAAPNNIMSAENANEGILHLLFYMALFSSPRTPRFFGIDNIDTGLNPQLCRDLMVVLTRLAKAHHKQALITTHNPAILDGLDLHDNDQRLFVVYRDDDGHTTCKRIKLKPDTGERKYKLSELWMRGYLGGLPRSF